MKRAALDGDLLYFPLVEVFYLLSRFRKTGRLIIKEKGNIYISEGKVTHAETEYTDGLDAFYALCLVKSGSFNFQPNEKASINTISKPLSELLEDIDTKEAELREYNKDLPPLSTIPEKSTKVPEGEKVALKKDEWRVLILADGKRTIEKIIGVSPLSEIDTYKSLSWLFKEGLIYDPKEKLRILNEGIEKVNKFIKAFGDGPWIKSAQEFIKENKLEDAISLAGNYLVLLKKSFPLDLDETKEFFNKLMLTLKEKASETLGKLLVNKKMKELHES
ncbi:DUF4388 domain-containing protein [candidate division WOR-3 bacterium]|nr:DUF4388 domain-containing protein [candidate division WOR-3 bacterium]